MSPLRNKLFLKATSAFMLSLRFINDGCTSPGNLLTESSTNILVFNLLSKIFKQIDHHKKMPPESSDGFFKYLK